MSLHPQLSSEVPVELALLLNQILYGLLDFNTQVIEAVAAVGKGVAERARLQLGNSYFWLKG
ncbi:hypothetical protein ACE6H2_007064 [Prunus campanulata]